MKKYFGSIDLTWKKLIIFAVIAGVYTAVMAILPFTAGTSFRDISIYLEWWILFGIIIICNSKSPKDSALKCFAFFLISQPLIYLIQVPFSPVGWGIFSYYKYWFMWTLACLPMGFFGYYIKKNNFLSLIILLPMLLLLAYLGLGYFSSVIENFPYHLLSFIACFLIIIVVILNVFDKTKLKIISLSLVTLFLIGFGVLNGEINSEFESYKNLNDFDITYNGKLEVTYYRGTKHGNVEIISSSDEINSIKLNGRKNGKYEFMISDKTGNEYSFEYYFDKESNSVILERK